MGSEKRGRVDFVISNDRHHVAIMEPVVRGLVGRYACGLVSLCEFRGLDTPKERFERMGVGVRKLAAKFRRSSAGGGQGGGARAKRSRAWARKGSWHLMLAGPVERWLETKPDVVVLANDAAFPYDLIVGRLKAHGIPFVLVQEGIRFPLPTEADPTEYGQGGAAAIAAWGAASGEYFESVGADPGRIVLTGSPKFDGVVGADRRADAARLSDELGLRGKTLVVLSNPIDDQGFCSTAEKIALETRLARELAPLFEDADFRLVFKLHGRENAAALESAIGARIYSLHSNQQNVRRIVVTKDAPLYPLFLVSQAAVILASTVGLEALLFGVPLGVLEIPGFGFVYDYVSAGAAQGLRWDEPMAGQVSALMERKRGGEVATVSPATGSLATQPSRAEAYVARQLATREGAAERVGEVIVGVVEHDGRSSAK